MTDDGFLKITTPTDREIVLTRVFDAPRDLVFRAMTEPELLKRWLLGPPGWKMRRRGAFNEESWKAGILNHETHKTHEKKRLRVNDSGQNLRP